MSSLIEVVAYAITSYFSVFRRENHENETVKNDTLYPDVIVEKNTNREDRIQILKDADVDILSDIKQYVPFASAPRKTNLDIEWCKEKNDFIYLNDTTDSEDLLNRIRILNTKEQETNKCLSENSNVSELTTDVCVGSLSEPPGMLFEDIGDDMNDSLFLKNVWNTSKI
jgi:hypothetical protein